ncbi:hypothetical protein KAR91_80250, partial [Candidatus Pacearchaeota archaeon]|nr:hypothetical protein [Candidatus Pacearchaeota archaeon]
MKRIIFLIGFLAIAFIGNSQVKGERVEATYELIVVGDSIRGTTQVDENDTIMATKVYVDDATGVSGYDSLLFNNDISNLIHQEGKFYYDSIKQSWVGYIGELDVTFEFMYEDWIRVYNNTGQTIANGDVCYLSGVIADANNTPTVGFANAKWDSTAQSALGFATHSIEDGTYGVITKSGTVRDLNTIDLVTSGARLFLDTIDGGRRNTILPSPYYNISLGNAGKIDASDGTVEVSIGIGNNTQSVISIFNGAELETVTVDAVSDGTDMEVIISRTGELDISL